MFNNIKLLYKYKSQILFLAYEQIKKQYLETAFGVGWAVVKPMVFVFSFWFFFTVGIKRGTTPLDLFAGYMPWFVMSELIISGTGVIKANAVLVKTIKFPVMALPLVNVLSRMLVHIAVMVLVIIFYLFYGGKDYAPSIYYINFIYYWFVMVAFFTSITFLLSSLNTVVKDIGPLIAAIMQPLFWMTPVLYVPSEGKFEMIVKLVDPLYYFIAGYRETLLLDKAFFWESPLYNLYIWLVILIIYLVGIKFFNKIRPFMADLI